MRAQLAFVLGSLLMTGMPALKAQGQCQPVVIDQKIKAAIPTVVEGTVENRIGDLVADLSLTLTGSGKPKLKQTVTTDDKGHFHFDSVPAGKYDITILNTAGTAKRTEVQCDTNGTCTVAFTLKPPRKPGDCQNVHYQDRGAVMRGN